MLSNTAGQKQFRQEIKKCNLLALKLNMRMFTMSIEIWAKKLTTTNKMTFYFNTDTAEEGAKASSTKQVKEWC